MRSRNVIAIAVWLAASAAAFRLASTDPGPAAAPAQFVAQEHRIAAAETGRLAEVNVKLGDRVRAGQLLARLDTTVIEREIAVAEARLRQLVAEPGAAAAEMESDTYASERSFQTDLANVTAELESARAAQATQQAELDAIHSEIARQHQFVKEGLARVDQAEQWELRARTLAPPVAAWPARIAAIADRRQAAAQRLDQWRQRHAAATAVDTREARLQPLKIRAAEQREQLRLLRARMEAAGIVSPADGEVVSLLARAGDVASSGVPFLIVYGAGPRSLVAYVNERSSLKAGTRALVRRRQPGRAPLTASVVRVADTVTELPARFWMMPTMPAWGRQAVLELTSSGTRLDAGEAVDVTFLPDGGD